MPDLLPPHPSPGFSVGNFRQAIERVISTDTEEATRLGVTIPHTGHEALVGRTTFFVGRRNQNLLREIKGEALVGVERPLLGQPGRLAFVSCIEDPLTLQLVCATGIPHTEIDGPHTVAERADLRELAVWAEHAHTRMFPYATITAICANAKQA